MSDWDDWIGRENQASDTLSPQLAARWLATFDLPLPGGGFQHGDLLPQGIHFALCPPEIPTGQLGEDGHPRREESDTGFLPPFPLPRRMWASSTMAFLRPMWIGAEIRRKSRLVSINEKTGSSGQLIFVAIAHEFHANGEHVLSEMQKLVYREAADSDTERVPPQPTSRRWDHRDWDAVRTVRPDPRLLFRYSALTFNTHRIHYDLPYARDVERYRGLIVHGPLIASLLLQLARAELGENRIQSFAFRGVGPACAGDDLHLAMRRTSEGVEMGAFAVDGRQVTKASASLE